MRIFNVIDAEFDMIERFGLAYASDPTTVLYVKWLKQVWLKHLFKTDPAWIFPVKPRKLPGFFEDDSGKPTDKLFVNLPRRGRVDLFAQSEWDAKDAEAGTLFYYCADGQSLFQYAPYLSSLRDYLRNDVFKDKDPETFDVRRYAVPNVETASAKWHTEQAARRVREAAEREALRVKQTLAGANGTGDQEGLDFIEIGSFKNQGEDYKILRLVTRAALVYESSRMHHCIDTYASDLYNTPVVLLSIRKISNLLQPILSAELTMVQPTAGRPGMRNVVQIQGACNQDADLYIPNITQNFPVILRGIDFSHLQPLSPPNGGDLVFEVRL